MRRSINVLRKAQQEVIRWLLYGRGFLGTGSSGRLEVGRLIMDFGEGRFVAGHRWGSFTPTFDGVQLTLGGDKTSEWSLRAFVTRPVQ